MRRTESGRWVQAASRCRSRKCPSCGVLWAGDTRVKLLANIEAYAGDVALVTVTAPGADELPWDSEALARGERVVERWAARRWNKQARHEWRAMHRKASQRAARAYRRMASDLDLEIAEQAGPFRVPPWRIVARSWEFQRRGVLHVHVVVPMATSLERMASQVYAEALDEFREAHGFGFVDRGKRSRSGAVWRRSLEVVPQVRAARYLAKYIASVEGGGKLGLSETVRHADVPPHVTYVSRGLTTATGVTMRTLRLRRYAHVLAAQRGGDSGAWWAALRDRQAGEALPLAVFRITWRGPPLWKLPDGYVATNGDLAIHCPR